MREKNFTKLEVGKTYRLKGVSVERAKTATRTIDVKVIGEYKNFYLVENELGIKESILKVDLYTKEIEVV